MSNRFERMISEAIQAKRPVLVNPTEEEIRRVTDELRQSGKLFCTVCRRPIRDAQYQTRRITMGTKFEAVAHLHAGCAAVLDEESDRPH